MRRFGLERSSRVRRRPDFERAYDTGIRVHGQFMTVFFVSNGLERSRFGVAATRKIGPAVDRNRAKRLARELFRQHRVSSGLDVVVVPRRDMLDAPFTRLEADFLAIVDRRNSGRSGDRPSARRGRDRNPRRH
mgnify:CR=1 FL=1